MDSSRAVNFLQLAQAYAGKGKYVEVESVYLQALKIYQTVQREFCAGVGSTLNNLGILHCMYGQHAQAEPLLTRVPVTKEKLLGLDHPDRALSVVNLVQLPVVQEQPEKAELLYRRNLAIRERVPGPSHPEVEKTPEDLANALRKLERADEVVSLELRAKNFRAKRS